MAVDHNEIFDKFKDNYMINEFGALKFHLICDHGQVKVGVLLIGSWVSRPILLKTYRRSTHFLRLQTC